LRRATERAGWSRPFLCAPVAPRRWAAALPRPSEVHTTWQTCTMCVHASPARPVRARAVRALRAFAPCARAAHVCVPVLCARCARAVCRRHVRARSHACCACPGCVCSSCAPSCCACGALVQRSSRSCGLRSSTSSTSGVTDTGRRRTKMHECGPGGRGASPFATPTAPPSVAGSAGYVYTAYPRPKKTQ